MHTLFQFIILAFWHFLMTQQNGAVSNLRIIHRSIFSHLRTNQSATHQMRDSSMLTNGIRMDFYSTNCSGAPSFVWNPHLILVHLVFFLFSCFRLHEQIIELPTCVFLVAISSSRSGKSDTLVIPGTPRFVQTLRQQGYLARGTSSRRPQFKAV